MYIYWPCFLGFENWGKPVTSVRPGFAIDNRSTVPRKKCKKKNCRQALDKLKLYQREIDWRVQEKTNYAEINFNGSFEPDWIE